MALLCLLAAASALVQFTPDQADWSTFQSKPLAVSSITAHDPDSVGSAAGSKCRLGSALARVLRLLRVRLRWL